MTAAAFATHLAFCACLALLSAAVVWGMTRVGALDTPGSRSSHTRPTPKGGGVGIVLAFLLGIGVLYRFAAFSRIADPYFRAVMLAAVGIAAVAYLDDMLYWPASVKLLAQVAAALLAVGGGLSLQFLRLPVLGTVAAGLVRARDHGGVDRGRDQRDELHRRAERPGLRRDRDRLRRAGRDRRLAGRARSSISPP